MFRIREEIGNVAVQGLAMTPSFYFMGLYLRIV